MKKKDIYFVIGGKKIKVGPDAVPIRAGTAKSAEGIRKTLRKLAGSAIFTQPEWMVKDE